MNTTKKLTTLLLALMTASMAFAYDFEVDGICYLINGSEATVTSWTPSHTFSNDYTGDVIIPETVSYQDVTYTVTAIGDNAFYSCSELTSVSIPSSVEKIGADAFLNCDSLNRVEIQDIAAWCNIKFESMGSNPISNTLRGVMWNAQDIELYVNGTLVTQLDIPEGVTSIGDYAFAGAQFDHVTFPNTLVSIGNDAFRQSMLEEVILPESLQSLGAHAFFICPYLQIVQINGGLEVIPESVFAYCSSLSDVSLPSTVKEIKQSAFRDCRALTTMPMPDSLQIIEDYAFDFSGIKQLKTGKSLTSIGGFAFANCNNLISVEIGDQVTTLGDEVFYGSYSLQKVIVGNGVHKIPSGFCADCEHLLSVVLGNDVDTLEEYCFYYCVRLNTVICKAEVPPVMNGAEDSFFPSAVFQNATLYVPSSSVGAYRTAYVWEKFQNIVAPGDVNGDGEVNVGDLNSVIDVVIMGGNAGHPRIVDADVNEDGEVNIGDVNAIIDIILEND